MYQFFSDKLYISIDTVTKKSIISYLESSNWYYFWLITNLKIYLSIFIIFLIKIIDKPRIPYTGSMCGPESIELKKYHTHTPETCSRLWVQTMCLQE